MQTRLRTYQTICVGAVSIRAIGALQVARIAVRTLSSRRTYDGAIGGDTGNSAHSPAPYQPMHRVKEHRNNSL